MNSTNTVYNFGAVLAGFDDYTPFDLVGKVGDLDRRKRHQQWLRRKFDHRVGQGQP